MSQEVKHFTRVNQNLRLMVEDLRMRQEGLTLESIKLQTKIKKQQDSKNQFKNDIFECINYITDYKKLKKGVVRLHKIYVATKDSESDEEEDGAKKGKSNKNAESQENDLLHDYTVKREYQEKNLQFLRKSLQHNTTAHKNDNQKIMKENVTLL